MTIKEIEILVTDAKKSPSPLNRSWAKIVDQLLQEIREKDEEIRRFKS